MNLGSKKITQLKQARPLRERLREATREAIFAAAEAIFAEQGLHAARVEDVAAAAGVSVGTLYNYFGDRQGLLEALLDAHRSELLSRIDRVLASGAGASAAERPAPGAPFRERLTAFVGEALDHFEKHRRLIAVLLEQELDQGRVRRAVPGKHRSAMRELARRAETLVRAGVAEGVLRSEDADLYAPLLLGMLRGVLVRAIDGRDDRPFGPRGPAIVRFFLRGAEVERRS